MLQKPQKLERLKLKMSEFDKVMAKQKNERVAKNAGSDKLLSQATARMKAADEAVATKKQVESMKKVMNASTVQDTKVETMKANAFAAKAMTTKINEALMKAE